MQLFPSQTGAVRRRNRHRHRAVDRDHEHVQQQAKGDERDAGQPDVAEEKQAHKERRPDESDAPRRPVVGHQRGSQDLDHRSGH
jgi:hypothetical protein